MMRLLRATQTKRRVAFFFSKVFRSALSVIWLIIDFYGFALSDRYIWTIPWPVSFEIQQYVVPIQKLISKQSCFVSKETTDVTVTRGPLWFNKV